MDLEKSIIQEKVLPEHTSFRERTLNLLANSVGNRFSLLTEADALLNFYTAFFSGNSAYNSPAEKIFSAVLSTGAFATGIYFGRTVGKVYKKTKRHIKIHGELEPEFVKRVILGSENGKLIGYCQLQGVYLAARNYNQLETFREAKKKYSNSILPNF